MKKSVKKNYIYNILYQILIIILPIITTPYIARVLGANGNGIYGYTISIVTYFVSLGSLGIALYGQREIAYVQNDKEKRSKIFWELVFIKTITLLISSTLFYIFFCTGGKYAFYYRILLLELLANIFDISWFYQGMEDFKKIVIRNFVIRTLSVLSIFLFVKTPKDVSIYLLIYVLSMLIGSISLWLGIFKFIKKPSDIKFKYHIKPILSLFIPQIAVLIYTVLDKTMIGSILHNMDEVGYYEQAQKIIKMLLTIITAVSTVMMPRIANLYALDNHDQINRYMNKTFKFVFLLAFPLMFGLIAVSKNFVPLFFGANYEKVSIVMSVSCVIVLFISISNIIGTQYLLPIKKQREYTISVVSGSIVNLILNLIFIRLLQSVGAAIATVFAEATVACIQFYFVRKIFNIKEILKGSINYVIAGIIMFAVCLTIDKIILGNMAGICVQVIAGVIVYFGTLFILRDKFLIDFIKVNLLSRFKKKA